MEARSLRSSIAFYLLLVATGPIFAASHRTENFIVTAPNRQQAVQVAEAAERFRRDLSLEWLERELPRWPEPCPIRVDVDPRKGAGGATSFSFQNQQPFGWEMNIQGSFERIMDSVLPHEVTHTIFATHFGGPLPRWADEGACTTVEHASERQKQEGWLIQFIQEQRGIPFNQMFAMTEYPNDILPLYAQGYSVARYLIAQGGKPKFVRFVGEGMSTNNWNIAVQKHYGYDRLGDLQLEWQDWLVRGQSVSDIRRDDSNDSDVVLASATIPERRAQPRARGERPVIEGQESDPFETRAASLASSDGWYARQVNSKPTQTNLDSGSKKQPTASRLPPTRTARIDRSRQARTVTPPTRSRGQGSSSSDDSGWTSLSIRSQRDSSLLR
ncbi:MAG: hypothetical protein KDB27_01590 [Planctomycetales bacterium]|nr:hypothetical protein [Planctomycetales bacterium]